MSKLLALTARLKVVLVAASVAVARGDVLPLVLISLVLNVAQLGTKPSSEKVERNSLVTSSNHDQGRPDLPT